MKKGIDELSRVAGDIIWKGTFCGSDGLIGDTVIGVKFKTGGTGV